MPSSSYKRKIKNGRVNFKVTEINYFDFRNHVSESPTSARGQRHIATLTFLRIMEAAYLVVLNVKFM